MTKVVDRSGVWLALILVLGFLLRVIGINFGLPHLYHADEPIVVNHALAYGTGDLNPHFFKIPPLASYLLFGIYGLYYFIGQGLGMFHVVDDFVLLFISDPSSFYFIGRLILGAFLGTFTIFFYYRLIRSHFGPEHALLGSFLFATCFLHVRDSHYIYTDIPLLFLLVLGFFPLFRILERDHWRDHVQYGLILGAAVAMKYNGVFLCVPYLICIVGQMISQNVYTVTKKILITMLCAILSYGLLNPYSLIDFNFFLSELLKQAQAEDSIGWLHHLRYSLSGGLGIPILILTVAGVSLSITNCHNEDFQKKYLLLSFLVVYYVVLSYFSQPYARYVLPLIPFVIFFASDGLICLFRKFSVTKSIAFCIILLIALPGIAKSCWSNYLFLQPDNRTVAFKWIRQNLKDGAKVALGTQFFMPQLKMSQTQLEIKQIELRSTENHSEAQSRRINHMLFVAKEDSSPRYVLNFFKNDPDIIDFYFSSPTLPYDFNVAIRSGVDYVVLSSIEGDKALKFIRDVKERGHLVKRFSPFRIHLHRALYDELALTGGPFTWKDLFLRTRNGQMLEIYKLVKDVV